MIQPQLESCNVPRQSLSNSKGIGSLFLKSCYWNVALYIPASWPVHIVSLYSFEVLLHCQLFPIPCFFNLKCKHSKEHWYMHSNPVYQYYSILVFTQHTGSSQFTISCLVWSYDRPPQMVLTTWFQSSEGCLSSHGHVIASWVLGNWPAFTAICNNPCVMWLQFTMWGLLMIFSKSAPQQTISLLKAVGIHLTTATKNWVSHIGDPLYNHHDFMTIMGRLHYASKSTSCSTKL